MNKIHIVFLCLTAMLLSSCGPDVPDGPGHVTVGKGVLVLNEGAYTSPSASLSFYDPVADTVANNLFSYVNNGAILGDVAQSLTLLNGKLYIVVNNSNQIYKVDATTLVCDTMEPYILLNFYSPRYMLPLAPVWVMS